jgi:hypothetical protein
LLTAWAFDLSPSLREIPMIQRARPGVPRRRFLVGSLAAGTAALTARSYARVIVANDRIRVGFIGVGGMGAIISATANRRHE